MKKLLDIPPALLAIYKKKARQNRRSCSAELILALEATLSPPPKEEVPKKNPKKTSHFKPPTIGEVQAYCTERGSSVDPQKFLDYYESNGWLVGKNKMKSWQAAVRTWERSAFAPQKASPKIGSREYYTSHQ